MRRNGNAQPYARPLLRIHTNPNICATVELSSSASPCLFSAIDGLTWGKKASCLVAVATTLQRQSYLRPRLELHPYHPYAPVLLV
mmetsp:Transcript_14283/g.43898  ORF Transcript_14283/g.43898 Transcript_14283/m.43898 type:complete len:85 (-) Transcript_14283:961-1215(-)